MFHAAGKPLVMLLLAASLGGCALTGQNAITEASPGTGLADRFTRLLDERCATPADAQLEAGAMREMRLLRAEWLLAALTRYGSARIEDYSGDEQADAAMLLVRVNDSINIVNRARADVSRDPNQFELYRADLIVALLNTASAAIEPALKTVNGFVLKPNTEDGLKLLGNYFKDQLYAQAYGATCTAFMQAAVSTSKRMEVRQRVEDHLREQCDRLAGQTGLKTQCAELAGK